MQFIDMEEVKGVEGGNEEKMKLQKSAGDRGDEGSIFIGVEEMLSAPCG